MNLIEALRTGYAFSRPDHDGTFVGIGYDQDGAGLCLIADNGEDQRFWPLSITSLLATDWERRQAWKANVLDDLHEKLVKMLKEPSEEASWIAVEPKKRKSKAKARKGKAKRKGKR